MTAKEYYERGITFYKKNEYEKALNEINKSLDLDKSNPKYLHLKATILWALWRLPEALIICDIALKINPINGSLWYRKGAILEKLDKTEEAINCFKNSIQYSPENPLPWIRLGVECREFHKYNEAIYYFEEALKIDDNLEQAWLELGETYKGLKHYNRAIDCYRKAIELDKRYSAPWRGLGDIYDILYQFEKAINCYRKAISLNAHSYAAWSGLGDVYTKLKNVDDALYSFQKALKINDNYAQAHHGLGVLYGHLGLLKKSLTHHRKSVAINNNLSIPLAGLGNALTRVGKNIEAITYFEEALKIEPEHFSSWNGMGITYYNLKNYKKAIYCFNQAIQINSYIGEPWSNIGVLFKHLRFLPEALRYQLSMRHFYRAINLEIKANFLVNYFSILHPNYMKHPFFLQHLFSFLPNSQKKALPNTLLKKTYHICNNINLFITHVESTGKSKNRNDWEWYYFLGLIKLFMGHPANALEIFKNQVLKEKSQNLATYYYMIQSCHAFLEDADPYLEKATQIAEKCRQTLPMKKKSGFGGFLGQTEVVLPSRAEVLQRYYAAHIFRLDTEIESAMECLEPIWNKTDFLPIAYLYYLLKYENISKKIETEKREAAFKKLDLNHHAALNEVSYQLAIPEDTTNTDNEFLAKKLELDQQEFLTEQDSLKILFEAPFPKIGKYILKKEQSNRDTHYAYGLHTHSIDPDRKEWWKPFYHYAHYYEIAGALTLFHTQAKHHLNQSNTVPSDTHKEFWESFTISKSNMLKMQEAIHQRELERLGQSFLEGAVQQFQKVASNIKYTPEELDRAIDEKLHESGNIKEASKRAFEELRQMPERTPNALRNRIVTKIEAHELGDDLVTYLYLIGYFFLKKDLSEQESIMLQFYAIYAVNWQQKTLSKITQGGLKDQFKTVFGEGYDQATIFVTAVNPVAGAAMIGLKPLAKGSMGELFVQFLQKLKNQKEMMLYNEPIKETIISLYGDGEPEKVMRVPAFKDAFLEYVGGLKANLGKERFEKEYPLYGFEEWVKN